MGNRLKLGQMFLVGFTACTVEQEHWIVQAIRQENLGGVLLFDRNIDGSRQNIVSPVQLKSLVKSLSQHAEIPIFIAIDQEGGKVCRLKGSDGFPATRSAAELARQGLEASRKQAEATARTLADCGINLNFAPVVDLDLNPDNPVIGRFQRSFGRDARQVADHAGVWVDAHRRYGLSSCLKHFPGHGSSGEDSHLGFVDITDHWQEQELLPYGRLIDEGRVDAVMTGHLVHRGLDPSGLPATLSPAIIDGLLRRKLGFDGLVFSDDLQMRAITQGWSFQQAVQKAVLAGVDVLIVGNNLNPRQDVVTRGIAIIREMLEQGMVSEERIRASLERIEALKKNRSRLF